MDTVSLVIIGIVALFGLIGVISGLSKGLIKSVIKLATIVLAVVVAFMLTPNILDKSSGYAEQLLASAPEQFAELFSASPTLVEYIPLLLTKVLAPVVFTVVLFVCLVVVAVVRGIVMLIVKALFKGKPNGISRLLGAVASGVGGVLIALCFVFPVTGYLTSVPTLYNNVKPIVESIVQVEIAPETDAFIEELPNGQAVSTVNGLTGKYFDKLVSYEADGETVSAIAELQLLTDLVNPAMDFVSSAGDVATMDVQAIKDINGIIGKSTKLRQIVAEVVSTAATNWKNDQPFMGLNLKESLGEYASAAEGTIQKLSVTTKDTIVADLNDLVDTIQTVQHVYVYIDMLQSGMATVAELEAKLADVLGSITPGTQKIISDFVDESVLSQIGNISHAGSAIVTDILTTVIADESLTNGEALVANEATAINNILHFAAGDGEVTAGALIESLENSQLVTDAVTSVVGSTEEKIVLTDTEQISAIQTEITQLQTTNPELAQSLAKLFGLE